MTFLNMMRTISPQQRAFFVIHASSPPAIAVTKVPAGILTAVAWVALPAYDFAFARQSRTRTATP